MDYAAESEILPYTLTAQSTDKRKNLILKRLESYLTSADEDLERTESDRISRYLYSNEKNKMASNLLYVSKQSVIVPANIPMKSSGEDSSSSKKRARDRAPEAVTGRHSASTSAAVLRTGPVSDLCISCCSRRCSVVCECGHSFACQECFFNMIELKHTPCIVCEAIVDKHVLLDIKNDKCARLLKGCTLVWSQKLLLRVAVNNVGIVQIFCKCVLSMEKF